MEPARLPQPVAVEQPFIYTVVNYWILFIKTFFDIMVLIVYFYTIAAEMQKQEVSGAFMLAIVEFALNLWFSFDLINWLNENDKTMICTFLLSPEYFNGKAIMTTFRHITMFACVLSYPEVRAHFVAICYIIKYALDYGFIRLAEFYKKKECECDKCVRQPLDVTNLEKEAIERNQKVLDNIEDIGLKNKLTENLRCKLCCVGINLYCCKQCSNGFCKECDTNLKRANLNKRCPFCNTTQISYNFITLPRMN